MWLLLLIHAASQSCFSILFFILCEQIVDFSNNQKARDPVNCVWKMSHILSPPGLPRVTHYCVYMLCLLCMSGSVRAHIGKQLFVESPFSDLQVKSQQLI